MKFSTFKTAFNNFLIILIFATSFIGCRLHSEELNLKPVSTKDTIVSSHMKQTIDNGNNVIYCSTFQLVWNELKEKFAKEDIKLEKEPEEVEFLNESMSTKNDLSESDYIATGGFVKDGIINSINKELKSKFESLHHQFLLQTAPPDDIIAYSFLYKNLKFAKEFESLSIPISFNSGNAQTQVKAFGIEKFSSKNHSELSKQVDIFDYRNENDFIIRLKSQKENDEIILAKIKPENTLLQNIETVESRIREGKKEVLKNDDTLQIPKFTFDISHSYDELKNKNFLNEALKEYCIAEAKQDIQFQLDEKGAVLKSEAYIHLRKSLANYRKYVLNKSFLIYLKEKNGKYPYFAMWVNNAELMQTQ